MPPNLTPSDVTSLIPDVADVALVGSGGQKLVFRGDMGGVTYAIKFAILPHDDDDDTAVEARAAREIEIMRDCGSSHMIKLGPLGLTIGRVKDQRLLYFTEEFIEGHDLGKRLADHGPIPHTEVIRFGIEIANAIRALWDIGKVHRDIKPRNVMCRTADGSFVLLDAGYAFDVVGKSLSQGLLVGTMPYFPPERFDYALRRAVVDFRSDMFSLGVTMYELATGSHPFWCPGDGSQQVFTRIMRHRPPPPSSIKPQIPASLDRVILRMLGKSPHLRYRTINKLIEALEEIGGT